MLSTCRISSEGRAPLLELELMSKRFQAIKSRQLAKEHREFLSSLTFNEKGYPMIEGHVAGIAGCYEFRKPRLKLVMGKLYWE